MKVYPNRYVQRTHGQIITIALLYARMLQITVNPPYSVSGFKEHLQLSNNTFSLLDCITNNGSEIEVLFVERIAQLLKPKGIAAVILPSTILSNDSASYTRAREQLLHNFKIRAIVQMGGKTFSAASISTIILFLEKYDEPPKRIQLVQDSIDAIFNGSELSEWEDQEIFDGYCARIGVTEDQYRSFISKCSIEDLKEIEYFQLYIDAYDKIKQKKGDFYSRIFQIEKEKMLYYALIYTQKTVIITAPTDNDGQKEFLGYDWSNRKGNEGIKILTPGGKLYNDQDRTAKGTLASVVRDSFSDRYSDLDDNCIKYTAITELQEMLTFTRLGFNKAIKTTVAKRKSIKSQYPFIRLDNQDSFSISIGKRVLSTEISSTGSIPVYSANVAKPFGMIDKLLITDFSTPSILW